MKRATLYTVIGALLLLIVGGFGYYIRETRGMFRERCAAVDAKFEDAAKQRAAIATDAAKAATGVEILLTRDPETRVEIVLPPTE